jgi:phosphoesterase RecJ-like protein
MNKMEILQAQIDKANNIVISTHVSPDGDAIGSSLALWHYLKSVGKDVTIIVPNDFPHFLKWLPNVAEVVIYEKDKEVAKAISDKADLYFCLDYNEPHRTAMYKDVLNASGAYKVLIDHHIGTPTWQDLSLCVVGASSTCELIFDTIVGLANEKAIDNNIAQCIYTGLLTDTGNFQYSATTPKVHRQAALLLERGVQPDVINNHINNSFNEDRLKFFGFCTSKKMKIIKENNLAYTFITKKEINQFNIGLGGTEGLVNEPMKIDGIDVSILFKQDKDKIKISFRSKKDIDISKFASTYFEGGGHKNAAGGISFLSLEDTEKKLLLLINKI